jgi:site-specific DNA-cytosine methylase
MGLKETILRKIFINLMEKSVYAYHGSPYKFDKFDLSKIGTGEGAQAFGWGLYFTDLESIARHYAKTLAKTNVITLEEFMVNNNVETVYEQYILKKYIDNYQDIDKTIEAQKKELQREKEKLTKVKKGDEIYDTSLWSIEDYIERTLGNITFSENVVKILEGVQQNLKNRNLYKVTLHKGKNPDQYTWLEWDKPISEIPTKNVAIEDLLDNEPFDRDLNFFLDRTKYEPTTSYDGIITINPRDNNGKQTWQRGRVYDVKGSCPTICASLFDLNITKDHKTWRKLTINECERLQGVPKDYTSIVSKNERGKQLGNGWNVDTVAFIFSFLRGGNFLNSFSHGSSIEAQK